MKDTLLNNWRTSLLAVSILVALLMFTQGKITASEFLAILAFFNVAGYLLTPDAAASAQPGPATGSRRLLRDVAYWVVLVLVGALVALSFLPLVRDAVQPGREFIRPEDTGAAPILPQSLPADDD